MNEQTPDPSDGEFEIDETAVEPGKTTNDLSKQDDVEVAADQSPVADPGEYDEDPDGGIQVLHEYPDGTKLIGHPAGIRLTENASPYEDVKPAEESGLGPFETGGGAQ